MVHFQRWASFSSVRPGQHAGSLDGDTTNALVVSSSKHGHTGSWDEDTTKPNLETLTYATTCLPLFFLLSATTWPDIFYVTTWPAIFYATTWPEICYATTWPGFRERHSVQILIFPLWWIELHKRMLSLPMKYSTLETIPLVRAGAVHVANCGLWQITIWNPPQHLLQFTGLNVIHLNTSLSYRHNIPISYHRSACVLMLAVCQERRPYIFYLWFWGNVWILQDKWFTHTQKQWYIEYRYI